MRNAAALRSLVHSINCLPTSSTNLFTSSHHGPRVSTEKGKRGLLQFACICSSFVLLAPRPPCQPAALNPRHEMGPLCHRMLHPTQHIYHLSMAQGTFHLAYDRLLVANPRALTLMELG
uniref:Uncharacterized protein n=1 Tax=Cacopsylla melanoneura TaxID=428564 RepID=A0A8D8UI77_9HEMI